jgi:hypothetical protein
VGRQPSPDPSSTIPSSRAIDGERPRWPTSSSTAWGRPGLDLCPMPSRSRLCIDTSTRSTGSRCGTVRLRLTPSPTSHMRRRGPTCDPTGLFTARTDPPSGRRLRVPPLSADRPPSSRPRRFKGGRPGDAETVLRPRPASELAPQRRPSPVLDRCRVDVAADRTGARKDGHPRGGGRGWGGRAPRRRRRWR